MMKLLLICVLTASSSDRVEVLGSPAAAVTRSCEVADLPCIRRLLLQKQDEVVSLAKQLGFREQQVELLQQSIKMITEQRDIAGSNAKALLESSAKLMPHWYESPILWFGVGMFGGMLLTVLAAVAVGQAAHL